MMHIDVFIKLNARTVASYVSQTKRTFKTGISEHRNHINQNTKDQLSLEQAHDFDNVKISDQEKI